MRQQIVNPFKTMQERFIKSDRDNLEWLVYWCLKSEVPPISIGRGKELLGFNTMNQMRDFLRRYEEYNKK